MKSKKAQMTKEANKNQNQTYKHREEYTDGGQQEGSLGAGDGWSTWVKGCVNSGLSVMEGLCHWSKRHSIRSTVNGIVIA